jgi:hypothetical protein
VSSCTLRIIIILMETIQDLYQIATPTAATPPARGQWAIELRLRAIQKMMATKSKFVTAVTSSEPEAPHPTNAVDTEAPHPPGFSVTAEAGRPQLPATMIRACPRHVRCRDLRVNE